MNKADFLFLECMISQLSEENYNIYNVLQELLTWLTNHAEALTKNEACKVLYASILEFIKCLSDGKMISKRELRPFIATLKDLQKGIIEKIKVCLVLEDSIPQDLFDFHETEIFSMEDNGQVLKEISTQPESLFIVLLNGEKENEITGIADLVMTVQDLVDMAQNVYPIDIFTYDRLYLMTKLQRIQKDKNTKVLIAGSSYSMVGVLESEMPVPAVNVAVNAQDLYYSLLSARVALDLDDGIDTVVLSCAYYFFFSDMEDSPSDYMLSVLSKVNYPVYKKLHGYEGSLKELYHGRDDEPLYDCFVSLESVRDYYQQVLMRNIQYQSYYNNYNVRSKGGMLSFDFKEKTDEQNFAGGKIRASAHNKNFNMERGKRNIKVLEEFLRDMEKANKKVILFIPPVTKFYRSGVSEEMKMAYEELVFPIVQKYSCCKLLDLFASEEFDVNDFQDYDHLNLCGAKKLSELIVQEIKK